MLLNIVIYSCAGQTGGVLGADVSFLIIIIISPSLSGPALGMLTQLCVMGQEMDHSFVLTGC